MNVTASAGIAPAWTATKPTPAAEAAPAAPADQSAGATVQPGEAPARTVAEQPAEPRRARPPEGQGTRIDIHV